MSNCQNQYDVLSGKPAVFRDVAISAAREDQLSAALLCDSSKQRMIGKKLKGLAHAQYLFGCSLRIFCGDKIKKPLKIGQRSASYLDRRHERILGRRALTADARAVR